MSPAALADITAAYCVLSKANAKAIPKQGPCRWSHRQDNVSITFQSREHDCPVDQDGKTYTRMNRDDSEARPVRTREGQYILSIYWHKPTTDSLGL